MAWLSTLELVDFRGYTHADVAFGPGASIIVGPNAQGKTNLLEAIYYAATGSSHRVTGDGPLVRRGAEAAIVRAGLVADDGRRRSVELEVRPGGRNRAKIDGQQHNRARDAVGVLRAVLFAPEDLGLVRGDPADRRRFLDDLLTMRRPAYLAARQDYEKVLRQRNALLKDARRRGGQLDATAEAWTHALVRAGASLLAARIAVVHALAAPTDGAYRELLAGTPEPAAADRVRLTYVMSTGRRVAASPDEGIPDPVDLAGELQDALAERATEELERGLTLVGPHRDELDLDVGELPAKGFASHGEAWSLALALKLASREVLHEVGDEPVVLLDDVFAELDVRRRRQLADRCDSFQQVLVTAAVDDDVPLAGPRYRVLAGGITPPERQSPMDPPSRGIGGHGEAYR